MAEEKKGGFHAFEKRVHEIEEEHEKEERKGSTGGEAAKREAGSEEAKTGRKEPPRK